MGFEILELLFILMLLINVLCIYYLYEDTKKIKVLEIRIKSLLAEQEKLLEKVKAWVEWSRK